MVSMTRLAIAPGCSVAVAGLSESERGTRVAVAVGDGVGVGVDVTVAVGGGVGRGVVVGGVVGATSAAMSLQPARAMTRDRVAVAAALAIMVLRI